MNTAVAKNHIETCYSMCPFCEQNCATELTVDRASKRIVKVRGDKKDPLSKGYICAKAHAIKDLHEDPKVLKQPHIKKNGKFVAVPWTQALDFAATRLKQVQAAHGKDSVAFFFGTGIAHIPGQAVFTSSLLTALETRQIYSTSSVDCHPHFLTAMAMFGGFASLPVPDIDNSDYFVLLGANPLQSNGSFMTAPGVSLRLKAIQARGGKVVVIDPRRTETADKADWHLSVNPGSDAALLLAVIKILFADNLVNLRHIEEYADNLDALRKIAEAFSIEDAAAFSGVAAADIHRFAHEFAAANRACIYGRIGSCMQEFGSLTNWLMVCVNALTGNLDRAGGAMFPRGAFEAILFSERYQNDVMPYDRYHSRVRGLPEMGGQLPTAVLAEEMEQPGEGQIRALVTMSGNPAMSLANGGGRLTKAIENLDFVVSLDIYINETSRHADVILPSPDHLSCSDFSVFFNFLMARDYARWYPPVFQRPEGALTDGEILCGLTARILGITPEEAELRALELLYEQLKSQGNPVVENMAFDDILRHLEGERDQDRMYDFLVRSGSYGDHFGRNPEGLTLAKLKNYPHGIDIGAIKPRIAEMIHLPGGKIDFAPQLIVNDIPRLKSRVLEKSSDSLHLVGRRQIRSCKSWMNNFPSLGKGEELCVLLINPDDACERHIKDGDMVAIKSRTGEVRVRAAVSAEMRPGVVSLPHGWGHTPLDASSQARAETGANYNLLADEELIDAPSCITRLNNIPVEVRPLA